MLQAAIQKPAVKISSDGVTISGFRVEGVGKDTTAKFNYYMENPAAAAGQRLDQPNAAILVEGRDFSIRDTTIFGAQVGVWAENADNISLQNTTLESCDSGVNVKSCRSGLIEGCLFSSCKKYGLDVEQCSDFWLENNRIISNANCGLLLKGSQNCSIERNVVSGNMFGLALWNSSQNQVRRNRADHNSYAILVTDRSNNNTIRDNVADENSNSEIVKGFGIGISLQENSSYNLVVNNSARKNFNGFDVSKGCKFNAIYANQASDNSHGIRMNENRNNLVFGNNFERNNINAYENASLNIWNTTFGNYYSDYRGRDENGDGIGDQPYALPGQDSKSSDHHPLIQPYGNASLDAEALRGEVKSYAVYGPADDEIPVMQRRGDTMVIASRIPTSPPKWSDSKPLDVSASPF
jgi:nitrous oxidase accessory protein